MRIERTVHVRHAASLENVRLGFVQKQTSDDCITHVRTFGQSGPVITQAAKHKRI